MKKKEKTLISKFIKEKRKQNKLNQTELAIKAGVGIRFLRDLEQNKITLRMDKVNDILRLFGCELGPVGMNREKILNNE